MAMPTRSSPSSSPGRSSGRRTPVTPTVLSSHPVTDLQTYARTPPILSGCPRRSLRMTSALCWPLQVQQRPPNGGGTGPFPAGDAAGGAGRTRSEGGEEDEGGEEQEFAVGNDVAEKVRIAAGGEGAQVEPGVDGARRAGAPSPAGARRGWRRRVPGCRRAAGAGCGRGPAPPARCAGRWRGRPPRRAGRRRAC